MSDLKYFIYSKEQFRERTEVEARLGRKFHVGTVIVRGQHKNYTQLVSNLDSIRYSDYKIVEKTNDLKSVKYNKPYAE